MDSWLKALIAAACVVVIGGGAYYAWGEYKAGQRRQLVAEHSACTDRLRAMENGTANSDNQQFLTRCVFHGYLTNADLEATTRRILNK